MNITASIPLSISVVAPNGKIYKPPTTSWSRKQTRFAYVKSNMLHWDNWFTGPGQYQFIIQDGETTLRFQHKINGNELAMEFWLIGGDELVLYESRRILPSPKQVYFSKIEPREKEGWVDVDLTNNTKSTLYGGYLGGMMYSVLQSKHNGQWQDWESGEACISMGGHDEVEPKQTTGLSTPSFREANNKPLAKGLYRVVTRYDKHLQYDGRITHRTLYQVSKEFRIQ